MPSCPISCGNWSKLYYYIVYRIIFKGLKDFILKEKFGIKNELNNHILIKSIYKYIGFIFFGFLFYWMKNRKNKNKANKTDIENAGTRFNNELIHYQKSNISKFSMRRFIIICLLYVLFLEFIEISYFYGFHDLDLWIFNIAFALIFLSRYYSINPYRHRLYSLSFIFITNFVILIIKSFQPDENGENVYKIVEKLFPSQYFCLLLIFFYILNSLSISFTRVEIKILMENKYISSYKIIFFIGSLGLILTLFVLIISTIFFHDKKDDPRYLDNFLLYCSNFTNHTWIEIFVTLLYLFICFMEYNYEILIIYYLNPIYFLISDSLYYGSQSIFSIYKIYDIKNDLTILADAFAFIGYSIYVEAIILNFCGLNKNTKMNITKRGIMESQNIEKMIEDDDEEDEDDEDKAKDKNMKELVSK